MLAPSSSILLWTCGRSTAMILDLLCRSSSDEALFTKNHAPFSLKFLNLCAGRP